MLFLAPRFWLPFIIIMAMILPQPPLPAGEPPARAYGGAEQNAASACVFFDDFSAANNGWPSFTQSDGTHSTTVKVENGYYLFRSAGWGWWLFNTKTYCENPIIEVDAQVVELGTITESYGISFGYNGTYPYYALRIYTDGFYHVDKRIAQSDYTTLVEPTFSPYINQGKASNHMMVKTIGKQITVAVNGHELASVLDPTYVPGRSGIWGVGHIEPDGIEVHFDNFSQNIADGAFVSGQITIPNPDDTGSVPLKEMKVELLKDGNVIQTTTSGGAADPGNYYFYLADPQPGDYRTRAHLVQPAAASIAGFEVKYMPPLLSDPIPYAETKTFSLADGVSTRQDLQFTETFLTAGGSSNLILFDRKWIEPLGVIYFHTQQVEDFAIHQLGVTGLPYIEIRAVDDKGTSYSLTNKLIYIHKDDASIRSSNRPENREWHEYFHFVMDQTILTSSEDPSCGNHQGFLNSTTLDSWSEGFAVFWAEALSEHLGDPNVGIYKDWYFLNFNSYTSWMTETGSKGKILQREDIAVAALLWDLHDAETSLDEENFDEDHLALSLNQVRDLLFKKNGTYQQIATVWDLRTVLQAAAVEQAKVDEIFSAHGFFGDKGWTVSSCSIQASGDETRQDGEVVGEGGRTGRHDLPDVPGANLLVTLVNRFGLPIEAGKVTITLTYDPPYGMYNATYQIPAFDSELFYIHLPPADIPATLHISGSDPHSPVYTITSDEFWAAVAATTTDIIGQTTFTISNHYSFLPVIQK